MRVAVVGSGVAGLAAAHALGSAHEVEVFEAASYAGGHVRTVPVRARDGREIPVDMGFIVFNEARYPRLSKLFATLGVATRATQMSFSVSRADGTLEYGTRGARALFARRRDVLRPAHYRLLLEIARFTRLGKRGLAMPGLSGLTLAEFLARNEVPADVVEHFVIPLGASIWSTSATQMLQFPAETYLRFCDAHGMFDLAGKPKWRTVVGGSQSYVRAWLPRIAARVHLESPVRRVVREPGGVVLELGAGGTRRFDRCVLATHADQSLALLGDPSAQERRVLGALRTSRNTAWLHTDASFLPRRTAARSAWNFLVDPATAANEGATLTYSMNRLQGIESDEEYCVTLNPARAIAPSRVHERVEFAHPLFDLAAINAQREVPQLQGQRGTYFCGAWQRYGFHEDGMWSGGRAAELLLGEAAHPPREERA